MRSPFLFALAAVLGLGALAPSFAAAQLQIGGRRANYGSVYLQGGFPNDPHVVPVVSGGAINASRAVRARGCRGFVSRQPDFILNLTNPHAFLRIFAESNGDTTLLINDPQGNWYCNDDAVGRNPMIDFQRPQAGQYDIWVGSYAARQNLHANLVVTELRHVQPGNVPQPQMQAQVQVQPFGQQGYVQQQPGTVRVGVQGGGYGGQVVVQGQQGYVQGQVQGQVQGGYVQQGQPYVQPGFGYDFQGQFESTPVNFSGQTIDQVYHQCIQFVSAAQLTMVDDVVVNGVAARNGPGYWDNNALCAIVALNARARGPAQAHVSGDVEGLPFSVSGDPATVQRVINTYLPIAVAHDTTIDDVTINGQRYHNGPGYWNGAQVAGMVAAQIRY